MCDRVPPWAHKTQKTMASQYDAHRKCSTMCGRVWVGVVFVNRWSGVQFPHPAPKKPLVCGDFFDFLRSSKTRTNGTKRTQNRGAGTQKGTQSPHLLVSDFLGPFCTMAKAKPTLPVRTIAAGEDPFAIHLLIQSADLAAAMGYELPDDLKKDQTLWGCAIKQTGVRLRERDRSLCTEKSLRVLRS